MCTLSVRMYFTLYSSSSSVIYTAPPPPISYGQLCLTVIPLTDGDCCCTVPAAGHHGYCRWVSQSISDQFLLAVPQFRLKWKGDFFSIRLWNSLPLNIRSALSISLHKSGFKILALHFQTYSVCPVCFMIVYVYFTYIQHFGTTIVVLNMLHPSKKKKDLETTVPPPPSHMGSSASQWSRLLMEIAAALSLLLVTMTFGI